MRQVAVTCRGGTSVVRNLKFLTPFFVFLTIIINIILSTNCSYVILPCVINSFLALKVFTLQLKRYYTLLKFSVCVSPISIIQIIILLLKLNSLACPPTISSDGRDTGIYIPVLKLSMDLVIWVLALVLNSIPFCLIGDQFFLFR